MKSYKKVKLQDISKKIGSGMTPLRTNTEYWNSKDIPWVKTELLGQYIISETSEYISQQAFDENSLTLFPANTLSIAMYGEGKTRGNVSIFGMPMTSNQACCNLIIDEQKADYKYVYYALKSNYDNLRNLASGVRNNLNADLIKNYEIPLPDLPTQKKIADVLSCIDDKIALNNKTNTELENMAKTIYDYWFTQFDFPDKNGHPYKTSGGQMVYNEILKRDIPARWEGFKLEKCLSRIATGLNPRDNFVLGNGNIKYLTVKNLNTDGTIDFSNCDLINEDALKLVHARSDIKKGDILFASIAPLGRCYLIQDTPNGWDINESVFSIRPNTDLISSIYLYMFFMDESFVKLAQSNSTGSVFKGIRINDLYSIPILVPEKQIMEKFSETITPIMNMKYRIEKENKELIELRDYLLPLLMNGQIEVK